MERLLQGIYWKSVLFNWLHELEVLMRSWTYFRYRYLRHFLPLMEPTISLSYSPSSVSRLYRKCGIPDVSKPYGLSRSVTGKALPFIHNTASVVLILSQMDPCELWGSYGGIKITIFSVVTPCNLPDGYLKTLLPWRWKQQVPLKLWYPYFKLHGVISQAIAIQINAVHIIILRFSYD
jgi:hypothetical protein